ncbi:MAG: hypothetical protein GEU93_11215 [Propionibacteriales bacterium]|nr:hypothetical protein [Propionibacteriales bacterium]
MPGRHTAPSRRGLAGTRPRRTGRFGVVVALGVLVILAVAMQSLLDSFESAEGACEGPETVTLAAAPEIAPVVRPAARELAGGEASGEDRCVRLEVSSRDSIEVLDAVQSGQPPPDLWIPATSNQLRELPDRAENRKTWWFATSPVGLVGRPDASRPDTWLAALRSDGARMLDPRESAPGLAALAGMHAEAVAGLSSGTALSSWLTANATRSSEGSNAAVTASALLASANLRRQNAPTWFPASEQELLSQVDASARQSVRLQVPKSGSVLLDYPMVSLADGQRGEIAVSAGDALVGYLNTSDGAEHLADAGFRTESGLPTETSTNVGRVREMTTMQAAGVSELVQLWTTLSLDARMLAVIDVSNSMTAAENARTRIEIARDALLGALEQMPETWHLGLWVYSIGLGDGGEDYRRLSPPSRSAARAPPSGPSCCPASRSCPTWSAAGPACTTPRSPPSAARGRTTNRTPSTASYSSPTAGTRTPTASGWRNCSAPYGGSTTPIGRCG